MKVKLYVLLAQVVGAYRLCKKEGDPFAFHIGKHRDRLFNLTKEHMPSGAGFDAGTSLDLGESTEEKLVFHTSFHHMNDNGCYDGWTTHKVVITPSLAYNYHMRVSGRNRNNIKNYISDTFHECLEKEVE